MTPFFQTSHRSLAYQFTVNAPLLCPLFSIFRKFLHFQPCFGQNSSSLDPNFSKFLFLRPLFFKENPLPWPYIFKPAWHTFTKKKLSAPLGTYLEATISGSLGVFGLIFIVVGSKNTCSLVTLITYVSDLIFSSWKVPSALVTTSFFPWTLTVAPATPLP